MTAGAVWPQLLSTALVGTQRRPPSIAATDSPLGTLVSASRDGDVLESAAVLTVARRAGVVATTGVSVPVAAPEDPRPVTGDAATARLGRLLDGGASESGLLTELLTLAAERGRRVPGRFLPALFNLARREVSLRPLVVAVGGARGEWLAAQYPAWRWASAWQWAKDATTAIDDEITWHEGTPGERAAYLAALRRRDRAAGRELLASVWPQERPEERAVFLGVLADGLDLADEAFCEAALDDRRSQVRTVAADLLTVLPGSAYRARMARRAAGYVTIGKHLVVTPPSECDAAMARDGIVRKPPHGTGERAWWLEQVIARTPLDHWTVPAAELLARRVADDWSATFRRAWARAAVTGRDPGWAVALVNAEFGRGQGAAVNDTVLSTSLYELMPPDAVLDLAMRALAEGVAREDLTHLVHLLDACPRPWPRPLATTVLRYLRDRAAVPSTVLAPWRLREVCRAAATGMPVDCAASARVLADEFRSVHSGNEHALVLDQFADTLSIRSQMHQELS